MRHRACALVGLALLWPLSGSGCRDKGNGHSGLADEMSRGADMAWTADLVDVAAGPETTDAAQPQDAGWATDSMEVWDGPAELDSLYADADAEAPADGDGAAAEFLFSFAVLADPHVDGDPAHREYLERAVERLIAEAAARSIELVFIVGDIAWGSTGELSNLIDAKGILDQLEEAGMHYIPAPGDNEIQAGEEQKFHEVFGPHYQYLAGVLDDWQQLSIPAEGLYLESFSFEHRGCHFVLPDFISRQPGNEGADIHDFPGGSWPWFQADIEAAAHGPAERITILAHHGMFRTGFEGVDKYLTPEGAMGQIIEFLCPYRNHVAACYGGHIHQNWYWEVFCSSGELIYEVWITDDTFDAVIPPETDDDRITIRVVEVWKAPDAFFYEQILLVEPITPE